MKIKMIFRIIFKPRRVYKSCLILFLSVVLYVIVYRNEYSIEEPILKEQFTLSTTVKIENNVNITTNRGHNTNNIVAQTIKKAEEIHLKYILLWTPTITPFNYIRKRGRVPFIANNCKYTNCYLTHKKFYFPDQTRFDAIVFSIAALKNIQKLPRYRSLRQKFVAASIEPPQKHPVVNPIFDGYFNWTWTYRLDSDILWRKFRIYNRIHREIGPKKHMRWSEWPKKLKDNELDIFLSMKKKSVVWLRNNCEVNKYNSVQLQYIMELENELNNNGLSLVTYSHCSGYDSCGSLTKCREIIFQNFYFYVAFEDYIDEDYVTNVLLLAFESYAVPIVFGGANYSRFLPPECYLDARRLNPREVANKVDDSMSNYNIFTQYFKWVYYYQYQSTGLESEVCNICTALNNENMVRKFTVHNQFRKEWSGEDSVIFSDFVFKAFEDDVELKNILKNGTYRDIRKAIMKKHLPDPEESVFVFNMDVLNITSTDETEFIPDELTLDTV